MPGDQCKHSTLIFDICISRDIWFSAIICIFAEFCCNLFFWVETLSSILWPVIPCIAINIAIMSFCDTKYWGLTLTIKSDGWRRGAGLTNGMITHSALTMARCIFQSRSKAWNPCALSLCEVLRKQCVNKWVKNTGGMTKGLDLKGHCSTDAVWPAEFLQHLDSCVSLGTNVLGTDDPAVHTGSTILIVALTSQVISIDHSLPSSCLPLLWIYTKTLLPTPLRKKVPKCYDSERKWTVFLR